MEKERRYCNSVPDPSEPVSAEMAAQEHGAGVFDIPELMTVADFLRIFRMGRTTFYREVNAGRLRILKLGTSTRIARRDAEAWMAHLPAIVRRPEGGG